MVDVFGSLEEMGGFEGTLSFNEIAETLSVPSWNRFAYKSRFLMVSFISIRGLKMSNSRQSDVVPPPPHQRILLVLIIVISRMLAQDGGVQFIKTKEAVVTKIWSPPCHGYEPFVRACSVSYYLFMLFVAWTPGGKNESKASSRTNQVLVIQTIGPFLYAHHVTGSITGTWPTPSECIAQ